MKKNYKGDALFVLISTFAVICIWVGSDIYNKSVSSTLDETLQFQLQPIPPSFDMKTIDKIRSRTRIAPNYTSLPQSPEASGEAELTITPTPILEPSVEIASEAGSLSL